MNLRHLHSPDEDLVEIGMNLKDYYPSGEWDILNVPAERHAKKYDCCPEFFVGNLVFSFIIESMMMAGTRQEEKVPL
jgi:nicotinic acetylcholine receptor